MEIEILGGGCARCEKLEQITRNAVEELGIEASFTKVKKLNEIMQYDIMETSALVINGAVKSSGCIPAKEEIMNWLTEA